MARFYNRTEIEITTEDISAFEDKIKYKLPETYKKQLLAFNGGLNAETVYFLGNGGDELYFSYFFPLIAEEEEDHLINRYSTFDLDLLPAHHLTIAALSGGYLAVCLAPEGYGSLYAYYSEVELEKVCNSLDEFIAGLHTDLAMHHCSVSITYEEFDIYCRNNHLKLPTSYRKFICPHNGGVPSLTAFLGDDEIVYQISHFFAIDQEERFLKVGEVTIPSSKGAIAHFQYETPLIPLHYYPFAMNNSEGIFCIKMSDNEFGSVHYFDFNHDELKRNRIASSFHHFHKNLEGAANF